jgi:hypothetical protein
MFAQKHTISKIVWMQFFVGPAVLTVQWLLATLHHSAFFFFDFGIVYGTGIGFDFFKVNVVTRIVMATGCASWA